MSTKHTPGPWKAERETTTMLAVRGPDFAMVADVAYRASTETNRANANLIAAAPELLDRLKAACNYIDVLGGDSKAHRAAIAKVTGAQL